MLVSVCRFVNSCVNLLLGYGPLFLCIWFRRVVCLFRFAGVCIWFIVAFVVLLIVLFG